MLDVVGVLFYFKFLCVSGYCILNITIIIEALNIVGLFTLQGAFLYTSILLTFITGTVFWSFNTEKKFRGLSSYVKLVFTINHLRLLINQ